MSHDEFEVRDGNAHVIAIVPDLDMAMRYLQSQPDGDYNIVGQDTDLILVKKDGISRPTGGTARGIKLITLDDATAEDLFNL